MSNPIISSIYHGSSVKHAKAVVKFKPEITIHNILPSKPGILSPYKDLNTYHISLNLMNQIKRDNLVEQSEIIELTEDNFVISEGPLKKYFKKPNFSSFDIPKLIHESFCIALYGESDKKLPSHVKEGKIIKKLFKTSESENTCTLTPDYNELWYESINRSLVFHITEVKTTMNPSEKNIDDKLNEAYNCYTSLEQFISNDVCFCITGICVSPDYLRYKSNYEFDKELMIESLIVVSAISRLLTPYSDTKYQSTPNFLIPRCDYIVPRGTLYNEFMDIKYNELEFSLNSDINLNHIINYYNLEFLKIMNNKEQISESLVKSCKTLPEKYKFTHLPIILPEKSFTMTNEFMNSTNSAHIHELYLNKKIDKRRYEIIKFINNLPFEHQEKSTKSKSRENKKRQILKLPGFLGDYFYEEDCKRGLFASQIFDFKDKVKAYSRGKSNNKENARNRIDQIIGSYNNINLDYFEEKYYNTENLKEKILEYQEKKHKLNMSPSNAQNFIDMLNMYFYSNKCEVYNIDNYLEVDTNMIKSFEGQDDERYQIIRFLQRLTEELVICRTNSLLKPNEFYVSKLKDYKCFLISHSTGYDSHMFFDLLWQGKSIDSLFGKYISIGDGWHITSTIRSMNPSKMSQLLTIQYKYGTLYSYFKSRDEKNIDSYLTMIFLIMIENKQNTLDMLSLFRYLYMNKSASHPNYKELCDKILESPLRSSLQAHIASIFIQMSKKYECEHCTVNTDSEEFYEQSINWITNQPCKSLEEVLDLSYTHYCLKSENTNNYFSDLNCVKKVLEEENKLSATRFFKYDKNYKDIGDKKSHEFNPVFLQKLGESVVDNIINRFGTVKKFLERFKLEMQNNYNWNNYATLKKSSSFSDNKEAKRIYCAEAVLNLFEKSTILNIEKLPLLQLQELSLLLHNGDNYLVTLFKKHQQVATREIFVMNIIMRISISIMECFFRIVGEAQPSEMMSKPKEKLKVSSMHELKVNTCIDTLGPRNTVRQITMTNSADASRWCQRFTMKNFFYYIKGLLTTLHNLANDNEQKSELCNLFNFFVNCLNAISRKTLFLEKRFANTVIHSMNQCSEITSLLKSMLKENNSNPEHAFIKNESNMMQGVCHFLSSSLHAAYMDIMSKTLERRWTINFKMLNINSKVIITPMCSSDDSSLIATIIYKQDDLVRLSEKFVKNLIQRKKTFSERQEKSLIYKTIINMTELKDNMRLYFGKTDITQNQEENLRRLLRRTVIWSQSYLMSIELNSFEYAKSEFGALLNKAKSTIASIGSKFEFNSSWYSRKQLYFAKIKYLTSGFNPSFKSVIYDRIQESVNYTTQLYKEGLYSEDIQVIASYMQLMHLRFLVPSSDSISLNKLRDTRNPYIGVYPVLRCPMNGILSLNHICIMLWYFIHEFKYFYSRFKDYKPFIMPRKFEKSKHFEFLNNLQISRDKLVSLINNINNDEQKQLSYLLYGTKNCRIKIYESLLSKGIDDVFNHVDVLQMFSFSAYAFNNHVLKGVYNAVVSRVKAIESMVRTDKPNLISLVDIDNRLNNHGLCSHDFVDGKVTLSKLIELSHITYENTFSDDLFYNLLDYSLRDQKTFFNSNFVKSKEHFKPTDVFRPIVAYATTQFDTRNITNLLEKLWSNSKKVNLTEADIALKNYITINHFPVKDTLKETVAQFSDCILSLKGAINTIKIDPSSVRLLLPKPVYKTDNYNSVIEENFLFRGSLKGSYQIPLIDSTMVKRTVFKPAPGNKELTPDRKNKWAPDIFFRRNYDIQDTYKMMRVWFHQPLMSLKNRIISIIMSEFNMRDSLVTELRSCNDTISPRDFRFSNERINYFMLLIDSIGLKTDLKIDFARIYKLKNYNFLFFGPNIGNLINSTSSGRPKTYETQKLNLRDHLINNKRYLSLDKSKISYQWIPCTKYEANRRKFQILELENFYYTLGVSPDYINNLLYLTLDLLINAGSGFFGRTGKETVPLKGILYSLCNYTSDKITIFNKELFLDFKSSSDENDYIQLGQTEKLKYKINHSCGIIYAIEEKTFSLFQNYVDIGYKTIISNYLDIYFNSFTVGYLPKGYRLMDSLGTKISELYIELNNGELKEYHNNKFKAITENLEIDVNECIIENLYNPENICKLEFWSTILSNYSILRSNPELYSHPTFNKEVIEEILRFRPDFFMKNKGSFYEAFEAKVQEDLDIEALDNAFGINSELYDEQEKLNVMQLLKDHNLLPNIQDLQEAEALEEQEIVWDEPIIETISESAPSIISKSNLNTSNQKTFVYDEFDIPVQEDVESVSSAEYSNISDYMQNNPDEAKSVVGFLQVHLGDFNLDNVMAADNEDGLRNLTDDIEIVQIPGKYQSLFSEYLKAYYSFYSENNLKNFIKLKRLFERADYYDEINQLKYKVSYESLVNLTNPPFYRDHVIQQEIKDDYRKLTKKYESKLSMIRLDVLLFQNFILSRYLSMKETLFLDLTKSMRNPPNYGDIINYYYYENKLSLTRPDPETILEDFIPEFSKIFKEYEISLQILEDTFSREETRINVRKIRGKYDKS
uniref:RNA-directed RNA polymerase L n=1 Tax=Dandong tick virus 1 TaxID=2972293 RepID=A0A9E7V278_9VIRU|nr:MAG: RNA-dependent RNA polymerase [Dandong tick virus 1]